MSAAVSAVQAIVKLHGLVVDRSEVRSLVANVDLNRLNRRTTRHAARTSRRVRTNAGRHLSQSRGLLLWSRLASAAHKSLHFLQGNGAIVVACEFPVTVSVHQTENYSHYRGTKDAAISTRVVVPITPSHHSAAHHSHHSAMITEEAVSRSALRSSRLR
jgi:hypothetical protein